LDKQNKLLLDCHKYREDLGLGIINIQRQSDSYALAQVYIYIDFYKVRPTKT